MKLFGSIYIIRNTINSKVYIGQTREQVQTRWHKHIYAANHSGHYAIYKAMRKYGIDNFYIETLETCSLETLNEREIYWISYYKANKNSGGYNMTPGGSKQRDPYNKSTVTDAEILAAFSAGNTACKIAKKYHTEVSRVTHLLQQFNITYGNSLQKIPTDIQKQIPQLYSMGYGRTTIGKYLGIDKTTVSKYLKQQNIPRRTTKETRLLERNLPKLINTTN